MVGGQSAGAAAPLAGRSAVQGTRRPVARTRPLRWRGIAAWPLAATCLHGCASFGATHVGVPTFSSGAETGVTTQAGATGTLAQGVAPRSLEEELGAGEAALAVGEHDAAEACFARAEALAPGNVRAQLGLAYVWLWRGAVERDEAALARATARLAACARACPGSARVNNLLRLLAAERELANLPEAQGAAARPGRQP